MIQAMAIRLAVAMLVLCVVGTASTVQAQDRDYRKEVIRFSPGSTDATVRDQLRGDQLVDYIVRARAGQRLRVDLRATNPSTYFNILAPGERDSALYNSSTARNSYSDALRRDGEYRVRVYLIRAAARRGERTEYTLNVELSGGGARTQDSSGLPPQQATYWEVYVANGPRLNIRERPSLSARVATRLRNGTIVRNRGCQNVEGRRWCEVERVESGAVLGWADARYLRQSRPPQDQLPTPPVVQPPSKPHEQATYWEIYVANGPHLNIRERPSHSARIATQLRNRTIVRNRGCQTVDGERWCAIENAESGAFLGWADAAYLRQSSPPHTQLPARPGGDALVPGTNFHATGNLPCARTGGEPLRNCRFGVTRRGGGSAWVTVFWPDGSSRVIRFDRREPVDFDRSQADGNKRLTYRKAGDRFLIRIGDEQFEINEAIVFGG